MSQNDEDQRNALLIAQMLNGSQNNSRPTPGTRGPAREVWNLSDFGFACNITECVPSRYLRIRALKKLKELTRNVKVLEQITKYLKNDTKWDSDIADRLAFDLKDTKKKMAG